jgi:ribonuclease VapC
LILDSSAVIAMLVGEPGYRALNAKLAAAASAAIGAPTLFETGMVLVSSMGESAAVDVARFLDRFEIAVIPFGDFHWQAGLEAFSRFGKGRHRAGLNLGDCMTYATALVADRPLLFVGNDFAQTDIQAA